MLDLQVRVFAHLDVFQSANLELGRDTSSVTKSGLTAVTAVSLWGYILVPSHHRLLTLYSSRWEVLRWLYKYRARPAL